MSNWEEEKQVKVGVIYLVSSKFNFLMLYSSSCLGQHVIVLLNLIFDNGDNIKWFPNNKL